MKKTVYLFSIILLTLFMFYIVFCTFGNFDYVDYFATFMKSYNIPIYLFTGAIIIYAFVSITGFKITKLNQKQMRITAIIIGLIMVTVQILVVYFIRSPLRSDPGMVFDQALDMFSTGSVSPTAMENYFSIYPNNISLCILEHLILKAASILGIQYEHYLFFLNIINILFIDWAMYFAFRIIKMLKNEMLAVKFLVLCAINPMLYAYSILVYTSTLSMPFIMGAIYYYLRATKEEKMIKKYLYSIVTIIILFLGFKLRATVIVSLVAILISMFMKIKGKYTKEMIINNCKIAVCIVLALFVVSVGYKHIEKNYVKFDYSETGFPVTHWLMMGAQGSGGFNVEDFNYTLNIPTKKERVEANLAEYKRRITNLGIGGTIHLVMNKVRVTWSDGLDATIDSLSDNETYYVINDYLTGSKKDVFVSYCHMYHLMLMILVLVSVIRGLKRNYDNPIFIIYLNLLGGIIFHSFWEAGAAYNICFTFLMILLAADGQELVCDYYSHTKVHRMNQAVYGVAVISSVILLFAGYQNMVKMPFKQYKIAANQDFHENEPPALKSKDEIIQTFVTSRAFNRIEIKVRNLTGEANKSLYELQLLDANDHVLVTDEVVGSLAIDTDYYRIPIETIAPEKATEYKIKIITKSADDENNLVFMLYNTGNWKIYEAGTLYVNGKESSGSLTFQICESVTETYFTRKEYILFAGSIIIIEILLAMCIVFNETNQKLQVSKESSDYQGTCQI